jgi:hypothetical protein
MAARLSALFSLAVLLTVPATAKDKKKPTLPEFVLRAQTVRVMIDPDAGEPLEQPTANATARDNVEKAFMEWGRYRLVMDGQKSDLVVVIRTGDGRVGRSTIKGGPIDQRPGVAQSTDDSIRIGTQHGTPPMTDPTAIPEDRSPHVSDEVGSPEDSFAVYLGISDHPLDSAPVWRHIAKNCLRPEPRVAAVEEFRKAVAEAEKPKIPKQP